MATTAQTRSDGERVRETFEALFDRRDFDFVRQFWTEESVDHFLALGISVRGARDLEAFFRELFAAIPDWTLAIENVVDGGEQVVVVQWRGFGTFNGASFQGIEPTGKPVRMRGCDVLRLTPDGKLVENTIYYDGAEYARQIGMLPSRYSPLDRGMTEAFNAVTRLRRRVGI